MAAPKPVALIIMDGFGLRNTVQGNAVAQAKKPNYDRYLEQLSAYNTDRLRRSCRFAGRPNG